jgi:hypothetical protein
VNRLAQETSPYLLQPEAVLALPLRGRAGFAGATVSRGVLQ